MKYTGSVEGRTKRGNWRYLEELRKLARDNRKKMTKTESKLWYEYLNKRPKGYKFLRQKPIGRFVVDFYCSKILLVVEVDGGSHEGRKNYDRGRDLELEQRGIKTVRFSSTEVMEDFDKVVSSIQGILEASLCQGR